VKQLVAQRVYGLALGYEDLNDHEELRNDLCLSKISKCLSGWGLFLLHNSR
jgi:hypothetical protein